MPLWLAGLFILVFSPQFFIILNNQLLGDGFQVGPILKKTYRFSIQYYGQFLTAIAIIALFYWILTLLFDSGLSSIITTYWSWHEILIFNFGSTLYQSSFDSFGDAAGFSARVFFNSQHLLFRIVSYGGA
ncbi:MAG: hypothetical protein IPL46_04450 [Saprospiraceae bacterium]|nr:hypothetical protein [Saprospiraceae bacterium]